jgi:hypothetical protein
MQFIVDVVVAVVGFALFVILALPEIALVLALIGALLGWIK